MRLVHLYKTLACLGRDGTVTGANEPLQRVEAEYERIAVALPQTLSPLAGYARSCESGHPCLVSANLRTMRTDQVFSVLSSEVSP